MPITLYRRFSLLFLGLFLILSSLACDQDTNGMPTGETECQDGNAVIQVLDGMFIIRCGCTEAVGTNSSVTQPFTCTMSKSGSLVFFLFSNIQYRHQIISLGSPSFTSLPVVDPENRLNSYSTGTLSTGTYSFSDAYGGGSSQAGAIIVP